MKPLRLREVLDFTHHFHTYFPMTFRIAGSCVTCRHCKDGTVKKHSPQACPSPVALSDLLKLTCLCFHISKVRIDFFYEI